jgi:hypothetical protein
MQHCCSTSIVANFVTVEPKYTKNMTKIYKKIAGSNIKEASHQESIELLSQYCQSEKDFFVSEMQ